MLMRFAIALALMTTLHPSIARAHHGLDFLVVQTAHLPQQGSGYVIGRVDYIAEEQDEMEFEPALLFGATDWMAFELHAHFEKPEGDSAHYESLAPALHFRLTPRDNKFSFGVSVEYELASDSDAEDVFGLTGILGYATAGWLVTANLQLDKPSNQSGELGFAIGARRALNASHGIGVEVFGSLENNGPSELLLGYYGELSQRFSINAGIGTGLDDGPDWAARSAFIWRFR